MKACYLLLVFSFLVLLLVGCTGDGHNRSYILSEVLDEEDAELHPNRL